MIVASLWLVPMVLLSGAQMTIDSAHIIPILCSSFIGVVLGDYFLFVAMARLGPRLTGVLFAANAPLAALLGWLILEEAISIKVVAAVILVLPGLF